MVTLEESYERCRQLNKRSGTTYYWSANLLPRVKRHHVHALYALCRYADDIVDGPNPTVDGPNPTVDGPNPTVDRRAAALAAFADRFFVDLARGRSDDAVLRAVVHTFRSFDLDATCAERFFRSMTMDLSVATYETYADLEVYMDGSAAVIGEMMLPILEPDDPDAARPLARDLGNAFQLTNFLRDVAEDLNRGRVYIPQEDLRRFGADPWARAVTPGWFALMNFEIARCRRLYESADRGIALLPASSRRSISAARDLYSGILERIEAVGCDVFSSRVRVTMARKLAMGLKVVRPRQFSPSKAART